MTTMDYERTMAGLEAAGTAQNRKVYARHGVEGPAFGVSYAELGKLQKRIGRDHQLAEQLWKSGNHDARILATRIADPDRMSSRDLDRWIRETDNHLVAGEVASLAHASAHRDRKIDRWTRARRELTAQAGWNLLTKKATDEPLIDDGWFAPFLERIEQEIEGAANRVRYAMNDALIAIGMRSAGLERRAKAAAKRIGTVEVDHGETGCQTPSAVEYIGRGKERFRARLEKLRKQAERRERARATA